MALTTRASSLVAAGRVNSSDTTAGCRCPSRRAEVASSRSLTCHGLAMSGSPN
jgi:hypothetical protein